MIQRTMREIIRVKNEEIEDSKWWPYYRPYTKDEKRKIIAKVIQVSLEAVFGNHIYQCNNSLYKQLKGGVIGARVTRIIARILMDRWEDILEKRLRKIGVKSFFLVKYVDDCNLATYKPGPKGNRCVRKKENGKEEWCLQWT